LPFRKTDPQDGFVKDGDDDMLVEEEQDEGFFDTIQAHKWYCYWIDPEYSERQQAGWRIYFQLLTSRSGSQLSQDQEQRGEQEASCSTAATGVEVFSIIFVNIPSTLCSAYSSCIQKKLTF
jgi:hypothetical protein